MKDSFNVEINKGDTVVVARRQGSSSWLTKAEVVDYKNGNPVLNFGKVSPRSWNNKPFTPYENIREYRSGSAAIAVLPKGPEVVAGTAPVIGSADGGTPGNVGIDSDGEYYTRDCNGNKVRW